MSGVTTAAVKNHKIRNWPAITCKSQENYRSYKSKPKQKRFRRCMEIFWREKHPTTILDMKQRNNQGYSIMKKHLLSELELEELSRLAEQNDTV